MFFDNPGTAFASFRSAASKNARLVFSCFREWTLNSFASETMKLAGASVPDEGPGPFAFASKEKVTAMLSHAGWLDIAARPVDFDYVAGEGENPVEDAVSFMRRIGPAARAIRSTDEAARPALIDGLREICEKHRQGDTVIFPSAAWIWTARA